MWLIHPVPPKASERCRILQLVEDKALYDQLRRNVRQMLENGNLWTDRARFVAERLAALDKRIQVGRDRKLARKGSR